MIKSLKLIAYFIRLPKTQGIIYLTFALIWLTLGILWLQNIFWIAGSGIWFFDAWLCFKAHKIRAEKYASE